METSADSVARSRATRYHVDATQEQHMRWLALDIETLPCTADDPAWLAREAAAEYPGPPSNYGAEARANHYARWVADQAAGAETRRRATSLHSGLGHIACIGLRWLDEPETVVKWTVAPALGSTTDRDRLAEVGRQMNFARDSLGFAEVGIIGHNLKSFDLPFLAAAFIRASLPIPWLLRNACRAAMRLDDHEGGRTNRHPRIIDTAELPATRARGGQVYVSMAEACRMVGMPPAETESGAKVYDWYLAGHYDRIEAHCREDVDRTVELVRRLDALGWVSL